MDQEKRIVGVCSVCTETTDLIRSDTGDDVCCDRCLGTFVAMLRDAQSEIMVYGQLEI